MKKLCVFLLKIGISVAILAFLFYQAAGATDENGNSLFTRLWQGQKDWSALSVGFAFSFLAVLITIVRWWWLVRLQKVPAKLLDTLRIGYVGYLFNLAPMGIVGGDLLKVWLLARHEKNTPNASAAIFAAAFLDRMMGLYALFMLASISILCAGVLTHPETSQVLYGISVAVLAAWGAGTVAGLAILIPPFKKPVSAENPDMLEEPETPNAPDTSNAPNASNAAKTPSTPKASKTPKTFRAKLAHFTRETVHSVRMYRQFPVQLILALAVCLLIHTLFAMSLFFLAKGIWTDLPIPTLAQHMYISPASNSTSAIPLPFGPYEAVLDLLYRDVIGTEAVGRGLIAALAYRIVCVIIATLGIVFYLTDRSEIRSTMAEHEAPAEKPETSPENQ